MISITITPETPQQISIIAQAMSALLSDVTPAPMPMPMPAPVPKAKTKPAPAPAAAALEVTLEQVRAKLSDLSKQSKSAEAKAMLAEYGVTKLTDVPAEKYAELLAKAETL